MTMENQLGQAPTPSQACPSSGRIRQPPKPEFYRNLFVFLYGSVLTSARVKDTNFRDNKRRATLCHTRHEVLSVRSTGADGVVRDCCRAKELLHSVWNYFQTVAGNGDSSGTWFNFGSGIGVVDFQGAPIGRFYGLNVGNTDTIVQRQADANMVESHPARGPVSGSAAPVLVGRVIYSYSSCSITLLHLQ